MLFHNKALIILKTTTINKSVFCSESLRAMDSLHSVSDSQLIDIHQKIGNLYLREKEYPKALSHLELADEKAQQLKSKHESLHNQTLKKNGS